MVLRGQYTEESSDDIADTTSQHRTADDGGCNGVHLHACRMRSRTASYMQEVHITADTCQQSAEQMGQELRSLNIDAQHQCTLVVAAHSIETAAHLRPAEHDKHQNDY